MNILRISVTLFFIFILACSSHPEPDWLFSQPHEEEYWIGFTDEQEEGNWQWVTGEEVTYTSWHGSQPDGSGNYALSFGFTNIAAGINTQYPSIKISGAILTDRMLSVSPVIMAI